MSSWYMSVDEILGKLEAGTEHAFADFSDDFATWVIFWGPEGGQK